MRACKHGLSRTPEYAAWVAMRHRCLSPLSQSYLRYGGRGITVCPEWLDVRVFVRDMGPRPSPAHSLERVDNDGPYGPGNCVWELRKRQNDNRSVSRRLTYEGETKTLSEWAEQAGIKYTTLLRRLDDWGWTAEKALHTSVTENRARRGRNERGQYA